VGDCTGDGLPDLLVTRSERFALHQLKEWILFRPGCDVGILNLSTRYTGWGANFIDFDNAGNLTCSSRTATRIQ